MQLVRLCMAGDGIQFVNPKEVNIPNTANFIELPDEPSNEQLAEYQLYRLVDEKPELLPLQRLKLLALTPDEEARTVTRTYDVVDYGQDEATKFLNNRLAQLQSMEAEGIVYENIFVDAFDVKLPHARVPIHFDVYQLTRMQEADQIALHIYGNAFVAKGDEKAVPLYDIARLKYIRSKSVAIKKAYHALASGDVSLMRTAYIELDRIIGQWLGEK